MQPLRRIGILAHPLRQGTAPIAQDIARWIEAHDIETWMRTAWDASRAQPLVENTDMVIAIGGDGAMLRAARVCAPEHVPVLGVNTGHLGFLTEISPEDWQTALETLLRGEYWLENRMMLRCEVRQRGVELTHGDALNDVVISRGAIARSVRLETYIDGGWATTYHGDGLIVATPTGSTAYALAVGGPILPPELKNILVVPIAPHLSMDRPMVLAQGSTIEVVVDPQSLTEVVLTMDGELIASLESGDQVVVRASESVGQFVRLRERNYFYRSLLDRLEPRVPARSPNSAAHINP
ncbi:MAG TPA: NAD(+)/NADH kinase [Aggregatilinea sp.]|jgi:NAD+ kinase|uniref:NAD(+)/NADH kinase n=1 Tax=Aggregatilinea sp. TaxID=2806333 RepID=UPI002B6607C1|nr:NAD(+)/NADH kinase [Aggregatilinea sp.]HML22711.1 NAD(+)/NADH kinase [Aggregatilinea sp.]